MFLGDWEIFTFVISRFLFFDYCGANFNRKRSWQMAEEELQYDNFRWRNPRETDHMIWPQSSKIKLSAPLMLDHIKSGADFMTTCLTTFRTWLPGDSSTLRTLYQFFRTKKHVLDAISRKKPYPFAWGGRGRKFKSCHSDHIECS